MWAKRAKELFAAFVLGNGILDLIHPWEGGRPGAGFRDGTVPKRSLRYVGFGAMSFNSCQKTGAQGTLAVAIYVDGEKKASNKTSAQYGIASSVDYPQ
jgi:hypothetical protein